MNTTFAPRRYVQLQSNLVDWDPSAGLYQSSQRVPFDADTALGMVASVVTQNGYAAINIDSYSFIASRFIEREAGCLQIAVKVVAITPLVSEIRVSLSAGEYDQFSNSHGVRGLKLLAKRIADATQYLSNLTSTV